MALKHVNAVIVGAGAGGGVVAKELAAGGLSIVQLEGPDVATPLQGLTGPRPIHQNPPHRLGADGKKVDSILPIGIRSIHQPQISLIHQCTGLKRVVW